LAVDIMTRPVVAASKSTTLRDAAIQMFLGGFSGMPVTERDGTVVGVVSEFDIIKAVRAGKKPEVTLVEAAMSTAVISAEVDAPLEDLVAIFERERVHRIPITAEGKLVGVVSRPDVLRWLVEPNFMTFS
jgi:CBS domain-containing protein